MNHLCRFIVIQLRLFNSLWNTSYVFLYLAVNLCSLLFANKLFYNLCFCFFLYTLSFLLFTKILLLHPFFKKGFTEEIKFLEETFCLLPNQKAFKSLLAHISLLFYTLFPFISFAMPKKGENSQSEGKNPNSTGEKDAKSEETGTLGEAVSALPRALGEAVSATTDSVSKATSNMLYDRLNACKEQAKHSTAVLNNKVDHFQKVIDQNQKLADDPSRNLFEREQAQQMVRRASLELMDTVREHPVYDCNPHSSRNEEQGRNDQNSAESD